MNNKGSDMGRPSIMNKKIAGGVVVLLAAGLSIALAKGVFTWGI